MRNVIGMAVLAGTAFVSCNPTEYEVSREIQIDAPAAAVYEVVNNHQYRQEWSPWEQSDPNLEMTYEGPESGVGAIYKWSGNDSVGTGSLEIVESREPEYIKSELTFVEPWESKSVVEWHFSEQNGNTTARWVTKGSFPGYLFWMDGEAMDEMMGPDFERGLERLKDFVEQNQTTADDLPTEVMRTTVSPLTYYFVEREVSFDELSEELYSQAYEQVYGYLGKDAGMVIEPPFAVFHEWDEENQRTRFEVAVAVESEQPGEGEVKRGTTYGGDVVMRIMKGPYEALGEVHGELYQYITDNGLQMAGSPWESYVVGPADDPDPQNWVTEVYYPVSESEGV